jgi:hypothetical protein
MPYPTNGLKQLLLFSFFFALLGCTTEQRIAIDFQKEFDKSPLLLRYEPSIYWANDKVLIPENLEDKLRDYYYDSAYYNSDFIQYLDADTFSLDFEYFLKERLNKNQFLLYTTDSILHFMQQRKPAVIIEVKQIEMLESSNYFVDTLIQEKATTYSMDDRLEISKPKAISDKIQLPTYEKKLQQSKPYLQINSNDFAYFQEFNTHTFYYAETQINQLTIQVWFEITVFQTDGSQRTEFVYFEQSFSDKILGQFESILEEIDHYQYEKEPLIQSDLFQIATNSAYEFGTMLTNYYINTVIGYRLKLNKPIAKKMYWDYNPASKRFIPNQNKGNYTILKREVQK